MLPAVDEALEGQLDELFACFEDLDLLELTVHLWISPGYFEPGRFGGEAHIDEQERLDAKFEQEERFESWLDAAMEVTRG